MRNRERIVKALISVSLVLSLTASSSAISGAEEKSEPTAAGEDSTLTDPKEKLSYALGMEIGTRLRKQSIEVDTDLYLRGMEDALAGGETLLTEKEARAALNELQEEIKKNQAARQSGIAPAGITVSFKLDPRLTQGSYMGERWVSPPTYTTVQEGKTCTVEARAPGVAAKGKRKKIRPRWIPTDPGMVTVSPIVGENVTITVRRDGESKLKVALPPAMRELTIKAVYQDNAIRVDISQ